MSPSLVILLAEDEELIGMTLQLALEDGGFEVRHVMTGEQAFAYFADAPVLCSGLVTDIRLGTGPDGWALARCAREAIPTIPVVYMSGDSAHEHSARGVPDSVMLQKPFAPVQLLTALATLVNAVPPDQPS